jgi:hypothetical protein
MNNLLVKELVLQSLERERCGVRIYETAVESAVDADLRSEWMRYLANTRRHVQVLEEVCKKFDFDAEETSSARQIVHDRGEALVATMRRARDTGDPATAQSVACECVFRAETEDYADWETLDLIARLCRHVPPLTTQLVHKLVRQPRPRARLSEAWA